MQILHHKQRFTDEERLKLDPNTVEYEYGEDLLRHLIRTSDDDINIQLVICHDACTREYFLRLDDEMDFAAFPIMYCPAYGRKIVD